MLDFLETLSFSVSFAQPPNYIRQITFWIKVHQQFHCYCKTHNNTHMWKKEMLINTLPMGIVLYCLNVNPILMEKCPTAKFTQKHTPNQKKIFFLSKLVKFYREMHKLNWGLWMKWLKSTSISTVNVHHLFEFLLLYS